MAREVFRLFTGVALVVLMAWVVAIAVVTVAGVGRESTGWPGCGGRPESGVAVSCSFGKIHGQGRCIGSSCSDGVARRAGFLYLRPVPLSRDPRAPWKTSF